MAFLDWTLAFPGIYVDLGRISWNLQPPVPLPLHTAPALRLQCVLHIFCFINWYRSTGLTQVRPCSSFCNLSLDIPYKQLFCFKTYCLETKHQIKYFKTTSTQHRSRITTFLLFHNYLDMSIFPLTSLFPFSFGAQVTLSLFLPSLLRHSPLLNSVGILCSPMLTA